MGMGVVCQYCLGVYHRVPLESYTSNSLLALSIPDVQLESGDEVGMACE